MPRAFFPLVMSSCLPSLIVNVDVSSDTSLTHPWCSRCDVTLKRTWVRNRKRRTWNRMKILEKNSSHHRDFCIYSTWRWLIMQKVIYCDILQKDKSDRLHACLSVSSVSFGLVYFFVCHPSWEYRSFQNLVYISSLMLCLQMELNEDTWSLIPHFNQSFIDGGSRDITSVSLFDSFHGLPVPFAVLEF